MTARSQEKMRVLFELLHTHNHVPYAAMSESLPSTTQGRWRAREFTAFLKGGTLPAYKQAQWNAWLDRVSEGTLRIQRERWFSQARKRAGYPPMVQVTHFAAGAKRMPDPRRVRLGLEWGRTGPALSYNGHARML